MQCSNVHEQNTKQLRYGSYARKCVCLHIQHWDCFPLEANTTLRLLAGKFRQLREASCNSASCNKEKLVPIRSTNYQTLFPRCLVLLCRHSALLKVLQIHCSQTTTSLWCNRCTWYSMYMVQHVEAGKGTDHALDTLQACSAYTGDVHCFHMLPAAQGQKPACTVC